MSSAESEMTTQNEKEKRYLKYTQCGDSEDNEPPESYKGTEIGKLESGKSACEAINQQITDWRAGKADKRGNKGHWDIITDYVNNPSIF